MRHHHLPYNIAIVGMGLAGSSTLWHLTHHFEELARQSILTHHDWQTMTISLFDKNQTMGSGFPHSREYNFPNHMLIGPAKFHVDLDGHSISDWMKNNITRFKQEIKRIFDYWLASAFFQRYSTQYITSKHLEYIKIYGNEYIALYDHYQQLAHEFIKRNVNTKKKMFALPRICYGMYFEDSCIEAIRRLQHLGINVKTRRCAKVVELQQPAKKLWKIVYKNIDHEKTHYDSIVYNQIILATGHWHEKNKFSQECPAYIDTIWPATSFIKRLEAIIQAKSLEQYCIHPNKNSITVRIAIRGSNLTAIDAVKSILRDGLYKEGKNGKLTFTPPPHVVSVSKNKQIRLAYKIDLISSGGRLPKVRGYKLDYKNQYLNRATIDNILARKNKITLKDIIRLFKKEITYAFTSYNMKPPKSLKEIADLNVEGFTRFKESYRQAQQIGKANKNAVLFTILTTRESNLPADVVRTIYDKMPAEDKLLFNNFFVTFFLAVNQPVIPETAKELLAIHDAGIIQVLAIGYDAVFKTDPSLYIYSKSLGKTLEYDIVIDALGQNLHTQFNPENLFQTLIKTGVLTTAKQKLNPEISDINLGKAYLSKHKNEQPNIIEKDSSGYYYDTGFICRQGTVPINKAGDAVRGLKILGIARSGFKEQGYSIAIGDGKEVAAAIIQELKLQLKL